LLEGDLLPLLRSGKSKAIQKDIISAKWKDVQHLIRG
jgi:hypothetical protein